APHWSASPRHRGTRRASSARRGTRTCSRPPGRGWGGGDRRDSSGTPVAEQVARIRALAPGDLRLRGADVDETGDPLVLAEAEEFAHGLVVGRPAGQPLGAEAVALCRDQQREAHAGG